MSHGELFHKRKGPDGMGRCKQEAVESCRGEALFSPLQREVKMKYRCKGTWTGNQLALVMEG